MPRPISTASTVGKARAALGITAAQLAKRSGVGLSTIQQIEQGRHPLTQEVARRLANAMVVDTAWLLYGSPKDEPKNSIGEPLDGKEYNRMYTMIANQALWNDEIRAFSEKYMRQAPFKVKLLLDAAIKSGNFIKVVTEFELFLRNTFKEYCHSAFKEYYDEVKPPKSGQPSQKRRKRA